MISRPGEPIAFLAPLANATKAARTENILGTALANPLLTRSSGRREPGWSSGLGVNPSPRTLVTGHDSNRPLQTLGGALNYMDRRRVPFLSGPSTTFASPFGIDDRATYGELQLGGTAQVSRSVSLFGQGSWGASLDRESSDDLDFSGQVGAKVAW